MSASLTHTYSILEFNKPSRHTPHSVLGETRIRDTQMRHCEGMVLLKDFLGAAKVAPKLKLSGFPLVVWRPAVWSPLVWTRISNPASSG